MKHYILLILFFASFRLVYSFEDISQDTSYISSSDQFLKRPNNNLNINVIGNASTVAVQYERLYFINPKFSMTFGLGIGFYEEIVGFLSNRNPNYYLTIPINLTCNIVWKAKHFLNVGFGSTIINGDKVDQPYYFYPILGYRVQITNRFNFTNIEF